MLAATGIIIGAGYMLWLYQRVFFMETNQKVAGLEDINLREIITLLPMIILIFWIGVYPNAFLGFMHESVKHLLERVNSGGMHEADITKIFWRLSNDKSCRILNA